MKNFTEFLFSKVYNSQFQKLRKTNYIEKALEMTIEDVKYNYSDLSSEEVIKRIKMNYNELAIYLYRLGSITYNNVDENIWQNIHWIMKECCSCEIFFSSEIDIGLHIVHSSGIVIGPRHKIGKGSL